MLEAGAAKGFSKELVVGCLVAIARDIGRDFESLQLRPPDHPERRTYQKEVCCVVLRLRVEAFA